MIAAKTCTDGNPTDPAVLTAKGQVVESQVVCNVSVFIPLPSGQSGHIGSTQSFGQPSGMKKLLIPISAAVLQQNRQFCHIVDVGIQTLSEDGQARALIRLDGPHDWCMENAYGPVDLREDHLPDVGIRTLFAF